MPEPRARNQDTDAGAAERHARRRHSGIEDFIDRWVLQLEQDPPSIAPREKQARAAGRPARAFQEDASRAERASRQNASPTDRAFREDASRAERASRQNASPTDRASREDASRPERASRRNASPMERASREEGSRAERAIAALTEVRKNGRTVVFEGSADTVVLLETEDGADHEGTVGARGPLANIAETARAAGATPERARALDFVGAWHGEPLDAVRASGDTVAWGFWRLAGADLAYAIDAWKKAAPGSFEAMLGRYGIDVSIDGESVELSVVDGELGDVSTGASAERTVRADARLVALLARAGRHPDAQRAQVETALRSAAPVLAIVGTAASTAAQACALLLALGMGARAREVLEGTRIDEARGRAAEAEWTAALVTRLRRERRTDLAHQLERAWSSPELTDVAREMDNAGDER